MCDKYVLKKKGLYKGRKNVTGILPTLMQEFITVDKNVTIRDICKMMYRHKNFYSLLFFQHYCGDYIELILSTKKAKVQEYDILNVYLSANLDKNKRDLELYYLWNVDGIKNKTAYAIDLSPLAEIVDVPIVLGNGILSDCRYSNPIEMTHKQMKTSITLYDLINCLFNEISFNGLPKRKEEMFNKIQKILKDNHIIGGKEIEKSISNIM